MTDLATIRSFTRTIPDGTNRTYIYEHLDLLIFSFNDVMWSGLVVRICVKTRAEGGERSDNEPIKSTEHTHYTTYISAYWWSGAGRCALSTDWVSDRAVGYEHVGDAGDDHGDASSHEDRHADRQYPNRAVNHLARQQITRSHATIDVHQRSGRLSRSVSHSLDSSQRQTISPRFQRSRQRFVGFPLD